MRRGRRRILYDPATLDTEPDPRWFDPAYWEAQEALDGGARGRGAVRFISHPGGRWALRHCHRGGLIGRLISDRYLYTGEARVRSFAEWRLLQRITALGLPAPAPVAASFSCHGLWYRADLLSARLDHDSTLAEALRAPAGIAAIPWSEIGGTIRRFHSAGVHHADLNAHNILIAGQTIYVIDFDRGAIRAAGRWRAANLERLARSLRKVTPPEHAAELDEAWETLRAGYGAD